MRPFRVLVAITAALLLASLVLFTVEEGTVAVVARFGDPRRVVEEPGLHLKWPDPIDQVFIVDRRLRLLDPSPAEYLTADKKNVVVDLACAWRVVEPVRFWTSAATVAGAELRLTDLVRSATGDVLSRHPFSDMVSTAAAGGSLADLEAEATSAAGERARRDFGIELLGVRFQRLTFPAQNKDAVFARMEQERQKISAGIRSEGQEKSQRIQADADREEARILAESDRRAREILGAAEAEATRTLAEAYARDPLLFELTERLRVLEKALDERSLLVLPSDHPLLRVLRGEPDVGDAPPSGGEGADGGAAAGGRR